jgi:hypothetical protein
MNYMLAMAIVGLGAFFVSAESNAQTAPATTITVHNSFASGTTLTLNSDSCTESPCFDNPPAEILGGGTSPAIVAQASAGTSSVSVSYTTISGGKTQISQRLPKLGAHAPWTSQRRSTPGRLHARSQQVLRTKPHVTSPWLSR